MGTCTRMAAVAALLLTGCGAGIVTGTWVVDADATVDGLIELALRRFGDVPPARRAALEERVRARLPERQMAQIRMMQIQVHRDRTFEMRDANGNTVRGQWAQQGDRYVFGRSGLTGDLGGGRLTLTGAGQPFDIILKRK